MIANAEHPSQAGSADGFGRWPVPVPGDRGLGSFTLCVNDARLTN